MAKKNAKPCPKKEMSQALTSAFVNLNRIKEMMESFAKIENPNWMETGDAQAVAEDLKNITDRIFGEGEYAD